MFYDIYVDLCKKAGEKPYVVASKVGAKSNSAVAQWQKGSVPRQPTLERIAEYFNVSIDYLLTGEEKQPSVSEGLSEEELTLIEAFRALPPDERQHVLSLLRLAAKQGQ